MELTGEQCVVAAQAMPVLLLALVVATRLAPPERARRGRPVIVLCGLLDLLGMPFAFNGIGDGVGSSLGWLVTLAVFVPLGALVGFLLPLDRGGWRTRPPVA